MQFKVTDSEIDSALSTIRSGYWEIDELKKCESVGIGFVKSIGYNAREFSKIGLKKFIVKDDLEKFNPYLIVASGSKINLVF
jgi:hypothetical protein